VPPNERYPSIPLDEIVGAPGRSAEMGYISGGLEVFDDVEEDIIWQGG
jgi:hypothetical protein